MSCYFAPRVEHGKPGFAVSHQQKVAAYMKFAATSSLPICLQFDALCYS